MKGPFKLQQKTEVLNKCVLPAMIYGAQTWTLTKKDEEKIRITQNKMERSILGIKLKDKIKLKEIKRRLGQETDFIATARGIKRDWVGHVARMKSDRWVYKISNWYIKEGRRKGKQKKRWDNDIVGMLGNKLYHRVAWDRREWKRLREAFAQGQICNI